MISIYNKSLSKSPDRPSSLRRLKSTSQGPLCCGECIIKEQYRRLPLRLLAVFRVAGADHLELPLSFQWIEKLGPNDYKPEGSPSD